MIELKSQQKELFSELWTGYKTRIFTFLSQDKSFTRENCQDLTQEVMIKIFRNIHKLKEDSSPAPWIYTICRRCAIDFKRRKEKKIRFTEFDDEIHHTLLYPGPEEQTINNKNMEQLHLIMEKLNTRSRQLLYLYYWEEMTCREIAVSLGLAIGTVKYELHRLRKKIRREWNEN